MLGKFDKILQSASELSWENFVILTLMVIILLSSFYGYRKIQAIDFSLQKATQQVEQRKQDNNFINQFGADYISVDATIHRYLVQLREQTEADWVLFLGVHNGQHIGPYHLKKISIIDEAVGVGNYPLYDKIQNVPMSLFSSSYPSFAEKDTIIARYAETSSEDAMAELVRNGIVFEVTTGTYIEDSNNPIGFIGLFYKSGKAERLINNQDMIDLRKTQLKRMKSLIQYELNRLYLMTNN